MLASSRHHTRARRGIVLVLVLAMLGLLALIGVTFATFAGQSRINARNFMQSVIQPQDDELMDFALQQLITDTSDVRSAIRGHSLARDMYGNDASNNGYLATNPVTGGNLLITSIAASTSVSGTYDVLTNIPIPSALPGMYGYNFTRWIMRISYTGTLTAGSPQPVSQTCEVLVDDYLPGANNTQYSGNGFHAFRISILDSVNSSHNVPPGLPTQPVQYIPGLMPNLWTVLNNPTLGYVSYNSYNPFPGWPVGANNAAYLALTAAFNASNVGNVAFTLDGRWLRAFNGPGLGALNVTVPIASTNGTSTQPLTTYGNYRYNGPVLAMAAAQYNQNNPNNRITLTGPNSVGMDEDYDACDLENWFLAIQSADGQVMIPSFHRPGVVRYDPANPTANFQANDWGLTSSGVNFRANQGADSMARILRPVAADGHDATTFPDLIPDPSTGKITYDVDNDGDGISDSVWVDLGYPSRRDANGNVYKPLFAFMVIGLNGRIPLNTAGNLAGGGATHAQHLGNSVSEIDPTYGLQNTFVYGSDIDPFNQIGNPTNGPLFNGPNGGINSTNNSQVDNAINVAGTAYQSVDVRLTQLRNLLAGTRPHTNPLVAANTNLNGDANIVYGSWPGTGTGAAYYLPNGIADLQDVPYTTDANGNPLVARTTPPVGGRWGEAASVPGVPFNNPNGGTNPPLNLVQVNYGNPVRAGYSFDVTDLLNTVNYGNTPFPRDAADDNYNAFDVYPNMVQNANRVGEYLDLDLYDAAGALMLPVERMRRFVTPIDINGTGRVQTWTPTGTPHDYGPDNFGRVQFNSYFRPAGVAGPINVAQSSLDTYPYGAIAPPAAGGYGSWTNTGTLSLWTSGETYVPDVTNNPFHGYEWYKVPNSNQVAGATAAAATYNFATLGGMPVDTVGLNTQGNPPVAFPTYDGTTNSSLRLDGVNEADEMNLYTLNPLLDSPYGPGDLEWLYRQQDVDGATLTSRLAQLAPVSFTNTIDGQRRRRLYALHSFETNNFAWTNDNPGGNFSNNAWFVPSPGMIGNVASPLQNASAAQLSQDRNGVNFPGLVALPSLAHRDKKINLNYPLPVSNDPNEPVRQKWISDTYQLLKMILPPTSIDSPEEKAQLSQFVINIIDFRDPDATMTHWVNPDVMLNPGSSTSGPNGTTYYTNPNLVPAGSTYVVANVSIPLDQYGMEYNPVAINEVLAYSTQSRPTTNGNASSTYSSRFFIELINTLTAAYNPTFTATTAAVTTYTPNNYYGYGPLTGATSTQPTGGNIAAPTTPPYQASTLDLGGFSYTAGNPYAGGCWDLVFTADNAMSRPDPFRGDLVYNTSGVTWYGLVPLNRDAFSGSVTSAPNDGDVTLLPLSPIANNPVGAATGYQNFTNYAMTPILTQPAQPTPPVNYFYVIGSPLGNYESNPITTTSGSPQYPCVSQLFNATYDPMGPAAGATTPFTWSAGILPVSPTITTQSGPPTNYQPKVPTNGSGGGSGSGGTGGTTNLAQYFWVCLRRPANPFAPVSATNPMCVVDSMRFPYMDGSPAASSAWTYNQITKLWSVNGAANTIYSAQRLQPYRGGHAVPMPNATGTLNPLGALTTTMPPDARYGYTEQIAVPQTYTRTTTFALANQGSTSTNASSNYYYHTLGYSNDSAENWDYFVFNDRDFSSVAELMLVPGCPPGLFTKQFVEFAPSQMNAADIFSQVTPVITPTSSVLTVNGTARNVQAGTLLTPFNTATAPFLDVSQAAVNSSLGSSPPSGTTLPAVVPAFPAAGPNYTGFIAPYNQPPPPYQVPVQPHAFPYLVDRFFYTGASTFYYPPSGAWLDPGSINNGTIVPVVGGPGGDGWFKMFEFFEVPSQAIGAIGPVAQGANFDWARQDSKPGLMNLNLVIDEEAFFSIFGRQSASGFNQSLLNSIELPLLANINNNGQLVLPYGMPLSAYNNGSPPIPLGGPPVPLVVSASQLNGAPNYVYPITDQTQLSQHGYLAIDPIALALNTAANGPNNGGAPLPPFLAGNRIKAAFAQFLWARHGGSGYVFGYGNGGTGQNNAVTTVNNQVNAGAVPSERPFRSLSYPDINYTIMRPAALPPSTVSNPAMVNGNPVLNAAAMVYTPLTQPTTSWYFLNPNFINPASGLGIPEGTEPNYYAPFVAISGQPPASYFPANTPIVYSGDPGVRNPFLNQGYVTGAVTLPTSPLTVLTVPPYCVYVPATTSPLSTTGTTNSLFSVPAGIPLPANVAMPSAGGVNPPLLDSVVMPPPIPLARLFQIPDSFGATQIQQMGYTGIMENNNQAVGNIPPALSNATDSGDPWINNLVANQMVSPWISNQGSYPPAYNNMANAPPFYTLNNGFPSLMWAGGTYYNNQSTTAPHVTATGVLPPASISTAPYIAPYLNLNLPNPPGPLPLYNGYAGAPNNTRGPYLGNNTTGAASNLTDDRQHPYWRSELIQKAMNLTTVRTHQYAVWITVGFFEVLRQGDVGMLGQGAPQLAFDLMGPEMGVLNGNNVRFRGFFLVDRLQLTGFNPGDVGGFRAAVVYRKVIQ